jgi:hypothetical protein
VVSMWMMKPHPQYPPLGTTLNSTIAVPKGYSTIAAPQDYSYSDSMPLIARIGILRVDVNANEYIQKYNDTEDYADAPGSLHECELSWCAKKFGPTQVENGVLKDSAPTQINFLDMHGYFSSSMEKCLGVSWGDAWFMTFRVRGYVDYSKDVDQYARLTESFSECPDVMAISEKEDMYIVNNVAGYAIT